MTASSLPAQWPELTRAALRRTVSRRTWSATGYAVLGLPLAVFGFLAVMPLLAAGAVLCLTPLGPWVLAAALSVARRLAGAHCRLAARLLGEQVPALAPVAATGPFAWRRGLLRDPDSWRAAGWLAVRLPVAAGIAAGAVLIWAYGLLLLTYPASMAVQGVPACAGALAVPVTATAVLAGCGLLVAAPWLLEGLLAVERRLLRLLLVPSVRAARARQADRNRTLAMTDAARTLRRIELDLHHGFRSRLATLAANLTLVRQAMAGDSGPDALPRARRLLEAAQANTAEALFELRELAWSIRPPVLDRGLPAALRVLAARSGAGADLPAGPLPLNPVVETTAWYCAAELLDNARRHAGAGQLRLALARREDRLVLSVHDDGRGGAAVRPGGGLALAAARVRAVGGRLLVDSPAGGPTDVRADLPLR